MLKKDEEVPISASLATIIVERVFDGVVMLAFVFLNLPELARLTSSSGFIGDIRTLALVGSGLFFGALAIFLVAAMFPEKTLAVVRATGSAHDADSLSGEDPGIVGTLPGWISRLKISRRGADGIPDFDRNLAIGDGKVLVCDARFPLPGQLFHAHADEWDR